MNQPEYILTDVFKQVCAQVQAALGIPVLNAQYGYIDELNETLKQYSDTVQFRTQKYPLVWLREPFTMRHNVPGFFGVVDDATIFIINGTTKDLKAERRMNENFKPIILPIYRQLFTELNNHGAIGLEYKRPHSTINRYYWGPKQQDEINDLIDCMEINNLLIKVNDNQNCLPPKSF